MELRLLKVEWSLRRNLLEGGERLPKPGNCPIEQAPA